MAGVFASEACPLAPLLPSRAAPPCPGRDDDHRIHRHRRHRPAQRDRDRRQPVRPVQPGYLEELARAHEEAGFDRVLVAHLVRLAGRLHRGRPGAVPHPAARGAAGPPARVRRPDLRGAEVRHPGRLPPRPGRAARHHRRRRRRPGPRRRPDRQGDPLPADRRVPRRAPPGVDVRHPVRLRRGVLPRSGRPVGGAAPARPDPGLLRRRVGGRHPGRRQARGRVRVLGRAAGRHPGTDRPGAAGGRPLRAGIPGSA